ncbi:MAG: hypothetical protein Fur0044_49100 [Anaerolineae bacterium]|nr:hypothetical protein [Anaerolineales bacterium]MCQ3971961.1 hypothetical protein [Anaerolineae bacterium]
MDQPHKRNANGPSVEEVLKPILYADIFDFPLTFDEIYKFLEFRTTPEEVKTLLAQAIESKAVILVDQFYTLPGKPHLINKRRERWAASQVLWPKAIRYGRWVAALPFIRMVSVTGSLAVDNPRDGVDDIDYLIITRPGRLWLCRALIILMVRFGRWRGVNLCPNYLLSENVLYFEENNLFIAREMLQMIPLYGQEFYIKMREINTWVTGYLPQGYGLNLEKINDRLSPLQLFVKKIGEFLLAGPIGDALEKIAQKIQITKHTRLAAKHGALDKVVFTPDTCKGHYDGHNNRTMTAYQQRLQAYSVNGNLKNGVSSK